MCAQFRRRPLSLLDRIYGFISGKTATSGVTLEAPITLVHDVSRQAERSGPGEYGGIVVVQYNATFGGTDEDSASGNIFDDFNIDNRDDWWAWFLAGYGFIDENDVADVTQISLTHEVPAAGTNLWGITVAADWPVFRHIGGTDPIVISNYHGLGESDASLLNGVEQRFPVLCPGGGYEWSWDIGGVINAPGLTVHALYWIGRKGCMPPGWG